MINLLVALTLLVSPVLAHDDRDDQPRHHHERSVYGAPGPVAGAGLPVLAVGYGIYWLARRRRMRS